VHPKGPGLVGGCGDDPAATRRSAHHDGLSPELGFVALLDGGEESIHVDMKNSAVHYRSLLRGWALLLVDAARIR
jgi:hypothetical protein